MKIRGAHRIMRVHEADEWERSDFPITCKSCLGDNPYLRMIIRNYGKECKVCTRPFTVFRWLPGQTARYKKTEICQTCSKLKNVCQVCLMDLEYGLPVQVTENFAEEHDRLTIRNYGKECKVCTRPFTVFKWLPGQTARYKKTEICRTCSKLKNVCQVCLMDLEYGLPVARSHVNREYFAEEHDRMTRAGLDYESLFRKMRLNDNILKLQRTTPYYKRNQPIVCSFYIRGECTRGAKCIYRHEMPNTGKLSHQNIKDRYYGENDPVAMKLLRKAGEMGTWVRPQFPKPDQNSWNQQRSVDHTGLLPRAVFSHTGAVNSFQEVGGSNTSENNGASSYLMPPHQSFPPLPYQEQYRPNHHHPLPGPMNHYGPPPETYM